MLHVNKDDSH